MTVRTCDRCGYKIDQSNVNTPNIRIDIGDHEFAENGRAAYVPQLDLCEPCRIALASCIRIFVANTK